MNQLNHLARLLKDAEDARRWREIWSKAQPIPGREHLADFQRQDAYGTEIHYSDYGNRDSIFGWEADHYPVPKSRGGSDDVSNLRPLQWQNNASLGDRGANALAELTWLMEGGYSRSGIVAPAPTQAYFAPSQGGLARGALAAFALPQGGLAAGALTRHAQSQGAGLDAVGELFGGGSLAAWLQPSRWR